LTIRFEEFPNPEAEQNNSYKDSFQIDGYCFYVKSNNRIPYHPTEFAITKD